MREEFIRILARLYQRQKLSLIAVDVRKATLKLLALLRDTLKPQWGYGKSQHQVLAGGPARASVVA